METVSSDTLRQIPVEEFVVFRMLYCGYIVEKYLTWHHLFVQRVCNTVQKAFFTAFFTFFISSTNKEK